MKRPVSLSYILAPSICKLDSLSKIVPSNPSRFNPPSEVQRVSPNGL
ncbi:MAG: hypothetical protein RO257_01555 [Candidatus Kapabacteria bacterium]|nr:hypothetical protein [Candidatus Kapabacteria bacterium]